MREVKRQFLKIMRLLKNKYILIPFVGVLLMLVLYTSYAFIRTELDWKTASQIKFSNLTYTLKVNNTSTSTITSAANSGTVYYDVEITSLNETDTRYLLTYNSTVAGVVVKTSSKSINASSGVIGEYGNGSGAARTKTIRIAVINNTASAATITLEVRGGYTWNSAGSTKPRLNYKIINNLVYETALNNYLSLSEEVAEVLNCTPTSILPCLYKENSNNYITYSGHKWRILGTYLINDEKVVKLILDDVLDTPVTYANVQSALTAFYNTLDTSYIRQSSPFTCTGTSTISCTGSANIGLLSKSEYDLIYGENSYLYTLPEKNYWTNTASGSNYYVGTSRGINSQEGISTAYVTPVIYLKSNIINSAEQVEYTITNLIPNNDFSSGTTGWGTNGGTLSVSSGIATITPGVSWTKPIGLSAPISMNVGDIIYTRVKAKAPATNYRFGLASSQYGAQVFSSPSITYVANTYIDSSYRYTLLDGQANGYFAFHNANATEGILYVDNTMLINLTDTFGAGNEPSKEWCDENLEYFNGTISKKAKVGEYKLGTKINPYVANNGVFLEVKLNEGSTSQNFSEIYPQNSIITLTQPTKSKHQFIEWEVTGTGSSVSGNTLTIGTDKTTLSAKWALQEFEYIPSSSLNPTPYYEYIVPKSGWYEMETWGAQGGMNMQNGALTYSAGAGAYTSGKIYLNANEDLYVYVGGKGSDGAANQIVSGGYNGGGQGDYDHNDNEGAGAGGGATDIRLSTTTNSINTRIMVAAGGGGAATGAAGGYAGDLIGGATTYSTGGTQIGGYSFAVGQPGEFVDVNVDVGGGGGGYYGGYANSSGATSTYKTSGAGGSSFISGYAGVTAIDEGSASDPRAHTNNNTQHYSGKYFVNGVMISGDKSMLNPTGATETGHSGNGYARIKYLGSNAPTRTNTKLNNVKYIKDCMNESSENNQNHWAEIQAIDTTGINRAQGKIGKLYNANGTEVTTAADSSTGFSLATDGIINNQYFAGSTYTGYQCFVVDISDEENDTYDLNEIGIWHYWPDGRTYYSNTTYVSSDGTNWTPVIATQEPETSQGKRVSAYDANTAVTPIYRVSNLVSNSSFLSSTVTGWYNPATGTQNSVNGTINTTYGLYINDTSTSGGAWTTYEYSFIDGHNYYLAADIRTTTGSGFLGLKGSSFNYVTSSVSSSYQIVSKIVTTSSFTGVQLGSSGANVFTGYIKNVRVFDLTATFGAGREPTKAWCDANLNYFDGTQALRLNY